MSHWELFAGWRRDDTVLLPALRPLVTYKEGRATGWLYLPEGPPPTPWPGLFTTLGPRLLADLETTTGIRFTAVAYQAYLDGTGCGWHHDRGWDIQAILSLGVTRSLGLRNDDGQLLVPLVHGDLLLMPSGFQDHWEHCVPEEPVTGERCSLVFRTRK